ncbi:MAG: arginine succinyltransferase [Verrucomicrobia bacterium]|nr:arginine succinyltransferase [Verrucomicrobiota bacterium]
MYSLRPIRESDLAGLVALAKSIDGSLTTLPPDPEFLAEKIETSLRAFRPRVRRPGDEYYLFVLEDMATGRIAGTSAIAARLGGFDPWYSYEIRHEKFVHAPLKIEKTMPVLHLKKVHRGPSEICSLFLQADARRHGVGRLLSLGRFLFMGAFPERFDKTVLAEMRGFVDQTGKSPFWEAVGRHFFEFDFYAADFLSGLGDKQFIEDLMPSHPLYLNLLAPEVQAVVGKVHHQTEPALALLLAEGFTQTAEVDIFDAGPLVQARTPDVRTIRKSRRARIRSAAAKVPPDTTVELLANGALDFRAALGGALAHEDGSVSIARAVSEALEVEAGDSIWISPVR